MGDALHTHGGVTSAQEARVADAGLLALQGPSTLDVRTGVLYGPGVSALVSGTTTTAPNWTYQIAPHNWVTSRGAANGPYRGALEAATTVSTALPPASNSRIDVIWVKQGDSAAGVPSPDASTAPVYGVTSGTAAASPTKPAIPVGAVEIATATVPSTATGGTSGSGVVITQTAQFTVARGADIPVRSQAERDALTAYDGLSVKRLDKGGAVEHRANGTWVADAPLAARSGGAYTVGAPPALGAARWGWQAGTEYGTTDNAGYFRVTYPTAFVSVSSVIAMSGNHGQVAYVTLADPTVFAKSGSSFVVRAYSAAGAVLNNAPLTVSWQAVGALQ